MSQTDYLKNNHDLSLPDWGPYSKRFYGISHLADPVRGTRFDFTVMPGIYRRQLGIPDVLRPSGYLPWDTDDNQENYSYRQQLEWRDVLYADISFSRIDDQTRLVRCELVNNSDLQTDFAIHLFASLEFQPIPTVEPRGCVWIDGIDNIGFTRKKPRHSDALNYDGARRGEVRCPGTVGGSAFALEAGDIIRFRIPEKGNGYLRYQVESAAVIEIAGRTVDIPAGGEFAELGELSGEIELVCREGSLKIDGIALADSMPVFTPSPNNSRPQFCTAIPDSVFIKYERIDHCYGIKWGFNSNFVRLFSVNDIRDVLLYSDRIHQPFLRAFDNHGGDNYLDSVMQPLPVAAHSSSVFYAVVCHGTEAEVKSRLAAMPDQPDEIYSQAKAKYLNLPLFGQSRMAALTMSNVVYPTYCGGKYNRHHTPGRYWNSLYTWDSGFIGLGLLELSLRRAVENLNVYLTEPGDPENAFIHHGSPVPVQFYLYLELWNRTHDRELLAYFYPRLKQYYEFLAGHNPQSYTRRYSNAGFICTWDYFYNSGGWDDYPPQLAMHGSGRKDIIPMTNTAQAIRCAKILQAAADELGIADSYQEDISFFAGAIQRYAWDPECGYFSYLIHDQSGNPAEIFRHSSGQNFNMGLDGATPLIADIVTPEQRRMLWSKLSSSEHCWTRCGISTVDQSAAYYRKDGYWNGSVWMPHQWFFWKAALNDGEGDFAWRIAETAITLWEQEVSASYACYEQFCITSGRGTGWHHFSGLSAPVLCWFGAYHTPERLTGGYDVWQRSCRFSESGVEAELEIGGSGGNTAILATLPEDEYRVEYAGEAYPLHQRGGAYEVLLPKNSSGLLKIFKS